MAKTPRLQEMMLLRTPRQKLRRVTTAERLAHPNLFSAKGSYYVKRSVTKITSKTPRVTVSKYKDYQQGVSHGAAAKQRLFGERGYQTAASETQARLQHAVATARQNLENLTAHRHKIGPFPGWEKKNHPQKRYFPKRHDLDEYRKQRRRKLRGTWIDDGEWHVMIDIAQAIGDPLVQRLRRS